jgi:glutamyl-tRNA reductase
VLNEYSIQYVEFGGYDMSIKMAGIDFNNASIAERERFALTQSGQAELLKHCGGRPGILGSVIISTCNRMELWLSCEDGCDVCPFSVLCDYLHTEQNACSGYFVIRDDGDAVRHLFELACGLKSMIFGEEQILTQVKEAISFSREAGAADPILQSLFHRAVTAAKKSKTQVRLKTVGSSAAQAAVEMLKQLLGDLNGTDCLVIGSGEMGRLAAKKLVSEGCRVAITLRAYKSGEAVIPTGCRAVDYEARYDCLKNAQIVISATRSPHHTLEYDKVKACLGGDNKILFDLALPRDIDPAAGTLPGIRLFDIDHLGGRLIDEDDKAAVERVREIIDEAIGEYERWLFIREQMPKISELGTLAAADAESRLCSYLKDAPLDDNCRQRIHQAASAAVSKAVESLLLTLHKNPSELLSVILADTKADVLRKNAASDAKLPPRFPLFVDLTGRIVAVIGAGPIALRRIRTLCAYPCHIQVTAPQVLPEIDDLYRAGKIVYRQKLYEPADLEDAFLVLAATDDRSLNHRIAMDARKAGRYCSIADCKEDCTFYFPATVHYDGGVIGICGTGDNHTRTKRMADGIRDYINFKELI